MTEDFNTAFEETFLSKCSRNASASSAVLMNTPPFGENTWTTSIVTSLAFVTKARTASDTLTNFLFLSTVSFTTSCAFASFTVAINSLRNPPPYPPTLRCSQSKMCSFSDDNTNFPSRIGTFIVSPKIVALMCAGQSSGPSMVCSKNVSFHDSGINVFNPLSNSSAFLPSLIVNEALVCLIITFNTPIFTSVMSTVVAIVVVAS
mmetsp:Transcript_10738/g.30497  ORF Transcript_10738/g.30497 Transcript_10738/m.30497 type:complete len:204 (-) Transcript_10738:514-1125(-)